jgi:HAD superfamily hydrolase (TIGR01509 family)
LRRLGERAEAVIFDMDGVLLLSNPIHRAAYQDILAPFGIAIEYEEYAGMRTRDCLMRILHSNGISISSEALDELSRRKTAVALRLLEDESPLAPAAVAVLEHLAARYPLALATSASEVTARAFLSRHGLERLFRSVITGESVRNAKPAPDVFFEACKRLSVAPAHSLVIEDSIPGIAAAVSAGAIPVAIEGTAPPVSLLAAGAAVVLSSLEELLQL